MYLLDKVPPGPRSPRTKGNNASVLRVELVQQREYGGVVAHGNEVLVNVKLPNPFHVRTESKPTRGLGCILRRTVTRTIHIVGSVVTNLGRPINVGYLSRKEIRNGLQRAAIAKGSRVVVDVKMIKANQFVVRDPFQHATLSIVNCKAFSTSRISRRCPNTRDQIVFLLQRLCLYRKILDILFFVLQERRLANRNVLPSPRVFNLGQHVVASPGNIGIKLFRGIRRFELFVPGC